MVGALLFGSPSDPSELSNLLDRYGKATVADALLDDSGEDKNIIDLPRRKSGPRSPRAS